MEDTRCCGTGTCIINDEGYCWCGQKWDGTRMCFPDKAESLGQDGTPTQTAKTAAQTPIGPQ